MFGHNFIGKREIAGVCVLMAFDIVIAHSIPTAWFCCCKKRYYHDYTTWYRKCFYYTTLQSCSTINSLA